MLAGSPAFLLAGWIVRVSEDPSSVGRLWARFLDRAPAIPSRMEPIRFRQLATWTEDAEDWVDIMTGVEMETLDSLEIDLVGKAVPACDCLVFEHHGSAALVGESYRAIYADILPAMERKPILPFNFETYYPDAGDPYAKDYRFRICIPLGKCHEALG
jgi:predicted transcriptional regulator YdeE